MALMVLADTAPPAAEELTTLARVRQELAGAVASHAPPPDQTQPDGTAPDALDRLRRREWIHRLLPLGYLAGASPDDQTFATALDRFVADLRHWNQARGAQALDAEPAPGALPGPALTALADCLLSFDGEIVLSSMPDPDATGIEARLLHYRLKCLQVYFGPVAAAVSDQTRIALKQVSMLLGLVTGAEAQDELMLPALRLSGDIRAMTSRLSDALAFPYHDANRRFHDIVVMHDSTRIYGYDSRADFSTVVATPDGFAGTSDLSRLVGFDPRAELGVDRRDPVDSIAARPRNRLAIALLQIALWGRGFYTGRFDGWDDSVLNDALLGAVESNTRGMGPLRVELGDGYFALNLPVIADLVLGQPDQPVPTFAAKGEYVDAFLDTANSPRPDTMVVDRVSVMLDDAGKAGRQVLTSAGGLIHRVIAGIKHGAMWIWDQITALAQPVVAVFRTLVRGVADTIGLVGQAAQAVGHFWLGRPIVTVDQDARGRTRLVALTRFQPDGDLVHWLAADASRDEADWHVRRCTALTAALDKMLVIAVKTVTLAALVIKASSPLGWLRLGLSILALLRDLLFPRAATAAPALGAS